MPDPLWFDEEARELLSGAMVIHLTRAECRIMASWLRRPGRIVTHEVMIGAVWPYPEEEPGDAMGTLHVHMSRLRAKLRSAGVTGAIGARMGLGTLIAEGVVIPCSDLIKS